MLLSVYLSWISSALVIALFLHALRLQKSYKPPFRFLELNPKEKILAMKMAYTKHGFKPFPSKQWITISEAPPSVIKYLPVALVIPLFMSTFLFFGSISLSIITEEEKTFLPAIIVSAVFYITHGVVYYKYQDRYLFDLKLLALDFIKANARTWIESVYKFIDKQEPLKQNHQRFYLLSHNLLDVDKNGIAPKKVAITFIDVNGSFTVHTRIIWHLKDSLIKLVKHNSFEVILNPSHQWLVEIYPNKNLIGFIYETDTEKNIDLILLKRKGLFIDGFLIIELLGGVKNAYPATQKDAIYFIEAFNERALQRADSR